MAFTLHGLVEEAARRDPSARAVTAADGALTYGELAAMSSAIARLLVDHGVREGDRVGLYQQKSLRGVAALLGILEAGAAYVPIDPQAPPDRARWIASHCKLSALFSAGRCLESLAGGDRALPVLVVSEGAAAPQGIAERVAYLDRALAAPAARGALPAVIDQDLAYILYTSGSTGTPKGVAITHAQSLAFVRTSTEVFELRPSDALISHAPFNFDLSIIDLFCAFLAGAQVVLLPERWLAFPAKIAGMLEEKGVTVWNSVPSALVQLAPHMEKRDLSKLRLIMFAGERYPLKHLRALRAAVPGATLLNVYGQTEANSSTWYRIDRIPDGDDAPLPIGKAFPNYDVMLLDLDGKPVTAPGAEGELFVRGGAVASGYYQDPERTAAAFVQNPLRPGAREIVYRTGDRMTHDADGNLIFLGRADAVVKCRGFRVELGEVEGVCGACPGVQESAAVAVPDDQAGNLLVLFVAPAEGADVSDAAILEHLAKKLPRYMLPERLVLERALPRSPNGKIDRRALTPRARALLGR